MTSEDREAFRCNTEPEDKPNNLPQSPHQLQASFPAPLHALAALPICRGGVHGPSGNYVAVMEARRLLYRHKKRQQAVNGNWAQAKEFGNLQSTLAFGQDVAMGPIHAFSCGWCGELI